MNPWHKVYLSVIGVMAACLFALAYWLDSGRAALLHQEHVSKSLTEALIRAAEREKHDRKVLVARQSANAVQARKTAQAQASLSEALQGDKPWSDTDVPPDVQKALSGLSGPAPEPPDGMPNSPTDSP